MRLVKESEEYDLKEDFPTLILDDEADYASMNNNPPGMRPSEINAHLIELRETIPQTVMQHILQLLKLV